MVEDMRFYKEIDLQDSPIGKISKDWKATKMGDVAHVKGRIGWRGLKASEYTTEGPYLIANKHLANNKIIWDKCDHLSEFRYTESSEIQLQINDVIISKDGTIGQPAFIDSLPDRATINSTMMLLRVKNDVLAPEFLFYFLQGPHFKRFLKQKISGTSIPHLFQRDMKELDFFIPSLAEQRGVVGVLGVVDSAIELVDRVIWKTERLKKGLMQTLLTKGIGHTEYKDTPIGKIPKEWGVQELGDESIADIVAGQSPPSSTYNKENRGLPFLQGKMEFGEMFPSPTTYCFEPIKIAKKNDVLLSVRAPVGDVNIAPSECCIGRGLAAIRAKVDKLNYLFLFYYLKLEGKRFEALSTGSTFKAIRIREIAKFSIPVPSVEEQQRIAEILSIIDKKLELERNEKARLGRVKRGLMDLLLTGKVRVKVD
jgi:type I restriction enzyme S subunit